MAISFAQVAAATPQTPTATVSVTYPAAQTAGNLNVVVVGWNDTTATMQSVKDSAGNTYHLAIGPTTGTGLQQSIYYAPNIVGGSNTVTVTFSQAAAFPDVRILEYRGVTALDVTAGARGSSTSASSGAATTTSANDLIFGADMVSTATLSAGSGFTSRIITSPDGDIAEDKIVTTAGSNSATATLNGSGPWVMQMVTFSDATGPVPTVSSVRPNSGSTAGGTAVTITGTNFAAGATVTFGRDGGDQRGGGEQHDDYGDHAGGECGCGDGDGDGERAEWQPGQRVHLHRFADGEQCDAEQRADGRRDGGDDHGDELCRGSDGDVWRRRRRPTWWW